MHAAVFCNACGPHAPIAFTMLRHVYEPDSLPTLDRSQILQTLTGMSTIRWWSMNPALDTCRSWVPRLLSGLGATCQWPAQVKERQLGVWPVVGLTMATATTATAPCVTSSFWVSGSPETTSHLYFVVPHKNCFATITMPSSAEHTHTDLGIFSIKENMNLDGNWKSHLSLSSTKGFPKAPTSKKIEEKKKIFNQQISATNQKRILGGPPSPSFRLTCHSRADPQEALNYPHQSITHFYTHKITYNYPFLFLCTKGKTKHTLVILFFPPSSSLETVFILKHPSTSNTSIFIFLEVCNRDWGVQKSFFY